LRTDGGGKVGDGWVGVVKVHLARPFFRGGHFEYRYRYHVPGQVLGAMHWV
jgi:hypothetical protein